MVPLSPNTAVPQGAFLPQGLGQGKTYFVKPRTGGDGASGRSPATAFKTLAKALSVCVAGQNDVVYLFAEGDTAADTTDYQTALLDWNKNNTHLIGVCASGMQNSRARIAFISTFVGTTGLFKVSASGCHFENLHFFAGVASANPTGCVEVTGSRNVFNKCHFVGMGDATMDIAGASSLKLTACTETEFNDCVIGLDTVTLGAAANSQILLGTSCNRVIFRRCYVLMYTNHATNHVFVRAAASSIDRWVNFEDTLFLNPTDIGSTALTYGFTVVSTTNGTLILSKGTGVLGATDWNNDSGNVRGVGASTVAAATYGLAVAVTK